MRRDSAHLPWARATAADAQGRSPFLAPPAQRSTESAAAPSFSVIIAAYQAADVIGEALASLAAQTVRPLEVIVCDDGSTDDLESALGPFRSDIVFVPKSHGGEASAKNAAAAVARGDFLLILDADDVYLPRRVEALTDLACARPDLDILTTDGYLVVGEQRIRRNYNRYWQFETVDQRRAILQRNFIFGLAAVRRNRFLEHDGFDESILWTTDWDLWLRLILDGSRAGLVTEPLALYRLRETSLTARRRELVLGKLSTLEKARRRPALGADDRAVLDRAIAAHGRELSMLDFQAAVAGGYPDARERAVDVLLAPGFSARNRVQATGAIVAPRLLRRLLRRRTVTSWVGAGGTRVSRNADGGLRARISRWAGARDG
jgi:glycosyltransferase involved in cell wall biosynthesis